MLTDSLINPTFIVAMTILAIVAGTVGAVFLFSDASVQNVVAGAIVGTGFGSVCGYFFGTTKGSQAKDETIAKSMPQATP